MTVIQLHPHQIHRNAFEEAEMTAAGALMGARMAGKDIPTTTADFVVAFRAAVAEAFDAGFRTARGEEP